MTGWLVLAFMLGFIAGAGVTVWCLLDMVLKAQDTRDGS